MTTKKNMRWTPLAALHKFRSRLLLGWLVGSALLAPGAAWALGLRIPSHDAEAMARGNAFAATADNPSALYYNPAGITQLEGHNAQFGMLSYFGINSRYESFTGTRAHTDFNIEPVPQFYYTYTPKGSPLSYGLGIYAPFGLGIEWPEDAFRTLAIQARLYYVTFNPTIAWRIHSTLSLAIGPTVDYSNITLRRGLLNPAPGTDYLKFRGEDYNVGFHAGLLWQPHQRWSFGLNYRSPSTMNYRGSTEYTGFGSTTSSAELNYPRIISGGVSFRPNPKWNIEAGVDWTDWNTLNTVYFRNTPLNAIVGPSLAFPLNWESSFFYQLGVTRYLNGGYFLSAGYFFSENSTSERDFNPTVPDTNLHTGSFGVGYKGDKWRWAVASQIITGPKREVVNSTPSLAGQSADGKYQFFIPAILLTVGYHF